MILLLLSVTLTGLLFIQGVYGGMVESIVENAIEKDCGYVVIENTAFRDDRTLSNSLESGPTLSKISKVIGETPLLARLLCQGLIQTALSGKGIELVGLNLSNGRELRGLRESLVEGSFLKSDDSRGVLIGRSLANDLGVQIGAKLVIRAQSLDGELTASAVRVRGLLDASNPRVDSMSVFLGLDHLQALLKSPGKISQVGLFPARVDQLDILVEKLSLELGDKVRVETWEGYYPAFAIGEEMMDMVNLILVSIAFLAVGLGVFDVILISMLDRMREFGILLALGTPYSKIRNLIVLEGLILGFVGYVIGAIGGSILLWYFHINPMDLSVFGNGPKTFGMIPYIPTAIHLEYYLRCFIILTFAMLISCSIPVYILKKLNPVQSLRFV
jgi:ABC-type lipoprotein release transport system permease subunit